MVYNYISIILKFTIITRFVRRVQALPPAQNPRITYVNGAFKMKKELNFKSLIILFLALVVLFIPTYIAIGSYYKNRQEPGKSGGERTLSLRDPDQRTNDFSEEGSDAEKETIALFDRMIKNGSAVNSIPESLSGGGFLLATYKVEGANSEEDKTTAYSFYFSTDTSNCFFRDSEGRAYKIAKDDATAFLATPYSVYLYSEAVPPVLTVSGDRVIKASQLDWYYLGYGNTYLPYRENSSDTEKLAYDVGNTVDFSFTTEPDSTVLKVYNGEELLYNGSYENLGSLNIKKNATLTFDLFAEWTKSDSASYYGSATYSFEATITAPAEFKIGQTEIFQGEFFVIAGINVDDPSKVVFSSEPQINSTPVFYPDGDTVCALIPVSYGLSNGNYKFTLSYGVTTADFNVKVNDYEYKYKDGKLDVSKALIESCYSSSDQLEYNELVKKICTLPEYSLSEGKLFSGAFLNYETKNVITTKGATLVLGFARNVKLTNASTPTSFEHTGVDFEVAKDTIVPAMNSGKVAYVGFCDVLGQFVVIDHGLGLKSWYAHLGSVTVKAGDDIEAGQAIGRTGDSGLTPVGRIHVGITVGEIPVAPYGLWAGRPVFPTFD